MGIVSLIVYAYVLLGLITMLAIVFRLGKTTFWDGVIIMALWPVFSFLLIVIELWDALKKWKR